MWIWPIGRVASERYVPAACAAGLIFMAYLTKTLFLVGFPCKKCLIAETMQSYLPRLGSKQACWLLFLVSLANSVLVLLVVYSKGGGEAGLFAGLLGFPGKLCFIASSCIFPGLGGSRLVCWFHPSILEGGGHLSQDGGGWSPLSSDC